MTLSHLACILMYGWDQFRRVNVVKSLALTQSYPDNKFWILGLLLLSYVSSEKEHGLIKKTTFS